MVGLLRSALGARRSALGARRSAYLSKRCAADWRPWLLATLLSVTAIGQNPVLTVPPLSNATVYRDFNGMPHIMATNEASAWYALGYEQARDALLWIQYSCKAAKGELTWVRGASGITNDMAVGVFGTYGRLSAMSTTQRRALLASTNPAVAANFYDNCVAYAAGADTYRRAVQNAPATPASPERSLRNWLDQNSLPGGQSNLAWVYQTPIAALDIAAQGATTSALMSFFWPQPLLNSAAAGYATLTGSSIGPAQVEPLPSDPLAPERGKLWLDEMRGRLSIGPGAASAFSGSNSFAWSGLYCKDASGPTTYAGLLGDPHQGVPPPIGNFTEAFLLSPNHLWFAHIKVTPPGASQPSLDLLGHFPHAAATTFSSHNRSVAMGGTLGSPNYLDTFLLRLDEAAGGSPAQPPQFYSHYHDNGSAPTNQTYRALVAQAVAVKLPNNLIVNVPYWRAESFGVVLPDGGEVTKFILGIGPQPQMPIVYGERSSPGLPAPRWRAGVPADPRRMRFWRSPQFDPVQTTQLLTSPMVVTLRAPIDAAVAGENMHFQLLRDFWDIAHATQVSEVMARTNGAAYSANVCFVDRTGRTFTTVLSAIPQRGDDTQLFANGYRTLDKWAVYSRSLGPVPARHSDDRMFDWRFGTSGTPDKPAPLLYLPYSTAAPPAGPFKPMTLQDQAGNVATPPTTHPATGPFRIESGFFAGACNDMVWGYSRKLDSLWWAGGNDTVQGSGSPSTGPFGNVIADNQLFQWALNAGVAYTTPLIGLEGPATQLAVISRFTKQAERIIRGAPAGLPPMTPAEMREFVVTPAQYREDAYVPPAGVTNYSPPLPPPIRQLREVVDHPSFTSSTGESPLVAAQKELAFFRDFWTTLYGTLWSGHSVVGSPGLQVSLRDLWVNGNVPGRLNQVFWYSNPTNPLNPGLTWIDLPPEFPLIDFYWPGTEVGRGITAGTVDPNGLSGTELSTLGALVNNTLVPWDPAGGAHYRNVPTSTGACLLEMMSVGYNAAGSQFGRHWIRLKRGQIEDGSLGWISLTGSGQAPGSAASLIRQDRPWSELKSLAFPFSQRTTLLARTGVTPPYDALYSSPGTIRTTLDPTHTNALVRFFLTLGNHYVEPSVNNGNPSRKLARYQLVNSSESRFLDEGFPAAYPLTDGLLRLTAARSLLEAAAYLQSIPPGGIPPYSQIFRARAYDHTGQIWPTLVPPQSVSDAPCVGGGLRSVVWNEALDPGRTPLRGFQPKFLGLGGSISSMVTLFPSVGSGVDSRFWSTPGQEIMGSSPTRFQVHMNAFTTNTLLPTHYDDFLNPANIFSTVTHTY